MKHLIEFEFNNNIKHIYLYDDDLKDAVSKLLKSDFMDNIIEISTDKLISFRNMPLFEIKLNFNYEEFTKYISNVPDTSTLKIYDFFGKLDDINKTIKNISKNTSLSNTIKTLNTNPEYYKKLLLDKHFKVLDVFYDENDKQFYSENYYKIVDIKNHTNVESDNIYYFFVSETNVDIKLSNDITKDFIAKCLEKIKVYDFRKQKYLIVSCENYCDVGSKNESDDDVCSVGSDNGHAHEYTYVLKVKDIFLIKVTVEVYASASGHAEDVNVSFENGDYKFFRDYSMFTHKLDYKSHLKHDFDFSKKEIWKKRKIRNLEKNQEVTQKESNKKYNANNNFILLMHNDN